MQTNPPLILYSCKIVLNLLLQHDHMVLPLLLHGLAPSPFSACPSILWIWSLSTFPGVCSTSPAPGTP